MKEVPFLKNGYPFFELFYCVRWDLKDGDMSAYIGEAELIVNRLFQQIADKDFWNEAIFFSSKDKYLNKASIKYLENRLHELALKAGRYSINQNTTTLSELSEAEQAELEEFLSHAKVLTATLGHKLFEALEETIEDNELQNQLFYCKNGAGANSKGSPSTEGFIVYKDSLFIIPEQPSLADGIRLERQKMLNDGTLKIEGAFYQLTKDYVFTSPSRAAAATLARSASGPFGMENSSRNSVEVF
ncbi:hypothetical protein HMPREF0765_2036 [Sphingobacterium spiritivorum ATCC 33300]|uniref:DUF4357 domain-containing protein n=2 Tax=Sphingobacterium spiritivorum TaxID=258 RepID=C2FXI0_SPHSI|nr:hypothetical protein HMPREF0765_2036 [Sphingobacterium spiritivorum ATCC 33300]